MAYEEVPTAVPGAVRWRRSTGPDPAPTRILPDGCLDLVWDGRRLFVAGPDSTARWHRSPGGASYVGLRLSRGTGPALVGVPADELRDRSVDVADLWPRAEAQALTGQVAADPVGAVERWVAARRSAHDVDVLGARLFRMAADGAPVSLMADRLGFSPRQLHRRCLSLFGYGPRRLSRVLRMGRALDAARDGTPLALVAARCGYADQGHLSREVRALAGAAPTELLGG